MWRWLREGFSVTAYGIKNNNTKANAQTDRILNENTLQFASYQCLRHHLVLFPSSYDPPSPPRPPFRSYIPSVWQKKLLQLHALRYTPFVWQTPPQLHPLHMSDPPSVTPPSYDRPPFSYTLYTTDPPPPSPDSPHEIPVHGDALPCQVWLQKVQILPTTPQFMVTHCHAKFGYKRYRFSPRHPSSWWRTAMPSLVTKGREIQNIYSGQSPHTWADERIVSNTPVPPTCTQMLMHAIEHRGCVDTVRESALEVDSGRKVPSHSLSKTALNN